MGACYGYARWMSGRARDVAVAVTGDGYGRTTWQSWLWVTGAEAGGRSGRRQQQSRKRSAGQAPATEEQAIDRAGASGSWALGLAGRPLQQPGGHAAAGRRQPQRAIGRSGTGVRDRGSKTKNASGWF